MTQQLLLGIYLKEMETWAHKNLYMHVHSSIYYSAELLDPNAQQLKSE